MDQFAHELKTQRMQKDIICSVKEEVKFYLIQTGYSKEMGANPIKRPIGEEIKNYLIKKDTELVIN